MVKYLTAIIVCNLPGGGNQFLKYRNIPEAKIKKLVAFAAKKPDAHHINLYNKDTKKFEKQIGAKELQEARL